MSTMRYRLATMAFLVMLFSMNGGNAQLPFRFFGPKSDKNPTSKSTPTDPKRFAQGQVEIAWLADPVTFPYYLEARINGSQLDVRGYVPNKVVREHALRIAQVHSALPINDVMQEHPSLLVRSVQMSPQQLQKSANTSLKVALPKQYHQLKVECGADGKVFVSGSVASDEEKVAVSHALRRLHGCTSVQNLTLAPTKTAQNPPPPGPPTDRPVVAQDPKTKSWLTWPFAKNSGGTTRDEPPLLEPKKPTPGGSGTKGTVVVETSRPKIEGPRLFPMEDPKNSMEVVKVQLPTPKTPVNMTAGEVQKRILSACPKVKNVDVVFLSATSLRITLEIREENDLNPIADRVFAMPELQNYQPELQFKISP
ncbi:MAG: BON domain-containing protein [Gemmataceae bacterium]|nr:BON domain-containing protein [Gemmataceae bacterium]